MSVPVVAGMLLLWAGREPGLLKGQRAGWRSAAAGAVQRLLVEDYPLLYTVSRCIFPPKSQA